MSTEAVIDSRFGAGHGPAARTMRDEHWLARLLWTPYTVLVYIPYLLASTFFFGSLAIFTSYLSRAFACRLGSVWAWLLCLLAFSPFKVTGREHVRRNQSYVMMSNHQSHFDVLAMLACWWRPFSWIMKLELRTIPVFGRACANMGHIYIDRANHEKAIASLAAARAIIKDGRGVMFFPEGTRSLQPRLLPFKKGGFVLAQDLGLPILPITISGTRRILPSGSLRLAPGPISITFHPPIDPAAYGGDRERLMQATRAAILSALPQDARDAELVAPASGPWSSLDRGR